MTLEAIIAAALADQADAVSCYAAADLLEERGEADLAFAWRWMGWHGKRPMLRVSGNFTYAWYGPDVMKYAEDRAAAVLPISVLAPMGSAEPDLHPQEIRAFRSREDAVAELADVFAQLRLLFVKPEGV